jgi:hypothetical protein
VAGKKGGAHKKGAAKKQTTTAKKDAPQAPPLGHHVQPTGDRRKRFRDEKD